MIYFSFVYTHLVYCIEVYGNTYSSYLHKLSSLNNKIIRILFSKHSRTHVKELYCMIDSLPLFKLHEFLILKFVHRCLFNQAIMPSIFADYFSFSKFSIKYNSRRQYDLYINQSNTNFGRRCLKTKACVLWNNLPNEVKLITVHSIFCKSAKKYYMLAIDDV